ncbi:hypothetical protein C8R44DRAFT_946976, partial [Mycena epipterygia]
MRKKDYRPHNPVLRPSTRSTIAHRAQYQPLLLFFIKFISVLVSFVFDPYCLQAVRLVAADAGVKPATAALGLIVYLCELFVLFFSVVHHLWPKFLPFHRSLRPPRRYHRTHISHLRLDRAIKYGLAFKVYRASHMEASHLRYPPYQQTQQQQNTGMAGSSQSSPLVDIDHGSSESIGDEDSDDEDGDSSNADNGFGPMPLLEPITNDDEEGNLLRKRIREAVQSGRLLKRKCTSRGRTPHHRPFRRPRLSTYTGGGEGIPTAEGSSLLDVSSSESDSDPLPPDFNLADWISTGRMWTDDLPKPVKRARNKARRVPAEAYTAAIPTSKFSVAELLKEDIPPVPADAQSGHAFQFFSFEPVTETSFDATWRDSIFAAVPFLPDLRLFFNNAWLSGAVSIKFPQLSACYPLWIENFLFDIQLFVRKRARWEQASEWLTRQSRDLALAERVQTCFDMFEFLAWDTIVPGLSP